MEPEKTRTVVECLVALGPGEPSFFDGCMDLAEEFTAIKKMYFAKVLTAHPDKGGDSTAFRNLQEAWEAIRELYDSDGVPIAGFRHYFAGEGAALHAGASTLRREGPPESWEWFAAAARESVPAYKVELAKSGVSKCAVRVKSLQHPSDAEKVITKGEVRFGSFDSQAGTYGRWHHLHCWRVPVAVWLALPTALDATGVEAALVAMQQIIFTGFCVLSAADKLAVVEHVSDKAHWAKPNKKTMKEATATAVGVRAAASASGGAGEEPAAAAADDKDDDEDNDDPYGDGGALVGDGAPAAVMAEGDALTPPTGVPVNSTALACAFGPGAAFVIPRPGVNGAKAGALADTTFVMTGTFPELGGGAGLDLGKTRAEAMISSFGGRVTSAVSGATTHLLVGHLPGASKLKKAESKGVARVDLRGLQAVLLGALPTLEAAPAPVLGALSAGYVSKRQLFLASAAAAAGGDARLLEDHTDAAAPPTRTKGAKGKKGKGKGAAKAATAVAGQKRKRGSAPEAEGVDGVSAETH